MSRLPSFMPSPTQRCLLLAGLENGETAVRAWEEWKKKVPFDDADYPSLLLLPLVYKNLYSGGFQDDLTERVKGIYRYFWVKNQKIFHAAQSIIGEFNKAGIKNLLLKGAPLSLEYYSDRGARPMGDLDILVEETQAKFAMDVFQKNGWGYLPELNKPFISTQHAAHFQLPSGEDVDLHWHLLHIRCRGDFDQPFWSDSVPIELNGVPTRTLSPTDHLLHVCVHGYVWDSAAPIRWIADAVMILRKKEIDWDRLLQTGRQLEVSIPVFQCLTYLKDSFGQAIPTNILKQLSEAPTSPLRRREFDLLSRPLGFFGKIPALWFRYHSERTDHDTSRSPFGFISYLRDWYGFDSASQLLVHLGKKGWGKLAKRPPLPKPLIFTPPD